MDVRETGSWQNIAIGNVEKAVTTQTPHNRFTDCNKKFRIYALKDNKVPVDFLAQLRLYASSLKLLSAKAT
ncbi:hypothetical protein ABEB36_013287 [Hypothenemus hampei]|uniref:Uncharacterized protein n=1 Tax=Hypothenemus hampei TaxID=57062 RepID=A0ABD1E7H9_HYPHA